MPTFKLIQNNRTIVVKSVTRNITVKNVMRKIILRQVGMRGLQGEQGPQGEPGLGLPPGGLTGQILIKESDQDYDTGWGSSEVNDKNYYQAFTNQSEVTVTHNLNKYPAVTVFDSTGDEVAGQVEHISVNQLILTFSASFTGQISCN